MISNFYSKHRAVHEVMWENIVQPDRPQMTTGLYDVCTFNAG